VDQEKSAKGEWKRWQGNRPCTLNPIFPLDQYRKDWARDDSKKAEEEGESERS